MARFAGTAHLLRSVGPPGVELRAVGPDADGVGEVHFRADHAFVVDDDGWVHTGDLGRVDDEDYLTLVGRLGDRIVRGGENVDPAEVEQVLASHPAVRDVAVVGVADRRWGEVVTAFVVPGNRDEPIDTDDLRAFARERLAGFKVPTEWVVVDELPRNDAGKLLRRRLQRGLNAVPQAWNAAPAWMSFCTSSVPRPNHSWRNSVVSAPRRPATMPTRPGVRFKRYGDAP